MLKRKWILILTRTARAGEPSDPPNLGGRQISVYISRRYSIQIDPFQDDHLIFQENLMGGHGYCLNGAMER